MRAYARRKQCKDSQKLNGYKKLPCILRENIIGEPGRYVWALKQEYRCTPTFVNLKSNTMKNTLQMYGLFRHLQECRDIKCVFVTLIIFYTFVLHLF